MVQILEGEDSLSPAGARERLVLERNGALPGVRLACQARIERDPGALVLTAGYW
jgi:ferredoxin